MKTNPLYLYSIFSILLYGCASAKIDYKALEGSELATVDFKLITKDLPITTISRIDIDDCKNPKFQRMGQLEYDSTITKTKIEAGKTFNIWIGAFQMPIPQAYMGGFQCFHAISFKPITGKEYEVTTSIGFEGCSSEVFEIIKSENDNKVKIRDSSQSSIPIKKEGDQWVFCN